MKEGPKDLPASEVWKLPHVEVSRDDFAAFLRWAGDHFPQRKLERSVTMICEPPAEHFYDLDLPKSLGHEAIAASSSLSSIWPGIVDEDPRPVDQRPTSWWREHCRIRQDLHDAWMADRPRMDEIEDGK